MKPNRVLQTIFWLGLMTCFFCLDSFTCAEEAPKIIRTLDFDECDPVKLQGAVMSINLANKTLTVAEKEIRLMDIGSDDGRQVTVLLNTHGKPEKIESFKAGQLIRIEGFAHPDGFVAASVIQKTTSIEGGRKARFSSLKRTQKKR